MVLLSIASKALAAAFVLSSGASAGKTISVSNWGDNPSHLPAMLVYTPDTIAANPAIILAVSVSTLLIQLTRDREIRPG